MNPIYYSLLVLFQSILKFLWWRYDLKKNEMLTRDDLKHVSIIDSLGISVFFDFTDLQSNTPFGFECEDGGESKK